MTPVSIKSSVGKGGSNQSSEVKIIQRALNDVPAVWAGANPKLEPDGNCGPLTRAAISHFQQWQFGWEDGKVTPGGVTLQRINDILTSSEAPGDPEAINVKWEFSYPFVGQVKKMGCWAATGAMLLWARDKKPYTLEQTLKKADGPHLSVYQGLFDLDMGLPWHHHAKFPQALGLQSEGHKTFTVKAVANWLSRGPIGLTLVFSNYTHIVVMTGMQGDGTLHGTYCKGYDPMGSHFLRSYRTLKGQWEAVTASKALWRQ